MIAYDEFGFEEEVPDPLPMEPEEPHMPIRIAFPEAGSSYMGGNSDGWEYRTVFTGSRLAATYDMVRQFLREEGYGDVPIPNDAETLKLFRRPRAPQLALFAERGYVHNPIKILFPSTPGQRNTLILCLYNEQVPDHLIRFHGLTIRTSNP